MTIRTASLREDTGGNVVEDNLSVRFHTTPKSILISVALAAGSSLYGYTTNVISGALALPSFNEQFLAVDTEAKIGGMLGPISDRYGRRVAMGAAGLFLTAGSALCAGSVHYAMFIVARFIAGIGSSIAFTVAPVFISELAPPHSRGKLVSLHVVGFNTGFLIFSLGSLGFSYMTDPVQWRLNFVINGALFVLLVILIFFVPESPRWLVSKDRVDEVSKILHRLHQSKYDPSGVVARTELIQITQQLDATKTLERGYKHIFTTPSLRKRAYCTVLVWFRACPLFGLSTAWLVCCILAAGVGGLAVDKLGRVLFMILGLTSCAVAMAVETAIQAEYLESTNKHAHATGVAFYFFFAILYNVFYDAGSFVYMAEIWPNHLRSEGMTIAMVTFYITTIIWNSPATVAMRSIKWGYYLFFIIIPIISSVVLWYMLPETKGLALEEIGEKFGEEPQTRRIQDIAMSREIDDLEPTKEIGEA